MNYSESARPAPDGVSVEKGNEYNDGLVYETQKATGCFGPSWSGWALIISSILVTPLIFAMALVTAMERDYTYVSLLFPVPYMVLVLSGAVVEHLPETAKLPIGSFLLGATALLALLQFPIYAVIYAVTKRRETVVPAMAVVHFLLAIAAYLIFVFTGS